MSVIDSLIGALRRRSDQQVENEQEMAINRMVINTILFGVALVIGYGDDRVGFDSLTRLYLFYLASGLAIFIHVQMFPKTRTWRRIVAMSTDISVLSYVAYQFGPTLIGYLYSAYLLIIYGYGFRYGVRWLSVSAAISIAAVGYVVRFSPAWQGHEITAGGLLVGLVIIPAYALKLVRNLWQAKAKAEESSRAKSMFIAAVSHDLRTPLNAIIGLGDILAASKQSQEDADMARMIGDAGRSLLGQIDSILEFSRLEVGGEAAPREPIELADMLYGVRELLDVSAQAKGVRLLLRVETPMPRRILSSARHIRDSLVNLVGNAIKFTPSGHVEISVRLVDRNDDRIRLRFEVRDTGIGIGADEQARIFDRFSQANESIRETYGGSGLGLAIARQLVAALGGDIGVSSVKGVGSVFWFEIDAADVDDENAPEFDGAQAILYSADAALAEAAREIGLAVREEADLSNLGAAGARAVGEPVATVIVDARLYTESLEWSAEERSKIERMGRGAVVVVADGDPDSALDERIGPCAVVVRRPVRRHDLAEAVQLAAQQCGTPDTSRDEAQPALSGLSVLVAEDNKTNQKVIAKMLSLSGQCATVVEDGRAALDALSKERFDVVLMDINMPGVDGVEATRRLRKFEEALGRRTPVIALTADVTPETRARCVAAGIDDCVTKPIDLPRLLQVIDSVLVERPAPDASGVREPAVAAPQRDEIESAIANDALSEINHAALADLERLGGPDFVREVATQFVADAVLILKELAAAVQTSDVEKFRDEAHALRSCSANVGARAIYELCLSWREISPQDFAVEGAAHVARLSQEFEKARAQLSPYVDKAA